MGRNLDVDIFDNYVFETGEYGTLAALGKTEEDGVARIGGAKTVDNNVVDCAAINRGYGNGGAVGVEERDVMKEEVAEGSTCHGAEFDAIGRGATRAVLDKYILGETSWTVAFEAENIVGGIHVAIAYNYVLTIDKIYSVVVPVAFAVDSLVFDDEVAALVILLVPTSRVAEGDAADEDVFAFAEVDVLGAVGLVGAVVFERVVDNTEVDKVYHVVGHLPPAPVDSALAGDGNVVLTNGEDKGSPADSGVLDVVEGIGGAKQDGAAVEIERHTALEVQGATDEGALGYYNAYLLIAQGEDVVSTVDGSLDACGVEGAGIATSTKVGNH